MRRKNWGKVLSLVLGTAFSFAACAPSNAADFTISKATIDPTVGSLTGLVFFPGLGGGSGHEKVDIGRIQLQGTNSSGASVTFDTYCADLFDVLQPGTFSDASPMSLPFDAARLTAAGTFLAHADPLVKDATTSAAAQIGLWEILNERAGTAYNVRSGSFHVYDTSLTASEALANSWLSNLVNADWQPDPSLSMAVLSPGAGNQTQIRMIPTTTLTAGAVPEPASWAMMAGGFAVLGGVLRSQRRQRENSEAA